jgi:hypothetical protein
VSIFRTALPFSEAIDSRQVRTVLPTDFRTQLLQEIPPQLRERAFFSAGVTNAEFLDRASAAVDDILSGKVDRATKRLELKKVLDALQYQPVQGEEGTLTDLSSDRRLNLILDQNLQAAQGYGRWKQGQDSAVLDEWPAQELVRVIDSKVKRDWAKRWADAGGQFFDGRMIALKNDPIWTKISRFGTPYPPFDFNSGMDVQDIDRDEAMQLGLIDRDTELLPQDRGFNEDLQASPEVRSNALATALQELFRGVARLGGDGVLRWIGGGTN